MRKYINFSFLLHIIIVYFIATSDYPQKLVGSPTLIEYAVKVFKDAERLGYKPPKFNTLTLRFINENPEKDSTTGNITMGYTTGYNGSYPVITINSFIWAHLTESGKYLLIAHEIGHGVWKRDHDDTTLPDFTKRSIMAPIMFDVDIFNEKRDYYLRELFSTCCDI